MIELPSWITDIPLRERGQEQTRFLLKLAALYASRDGSLETLSVMIRRHPKTLQTYALGQAERLSVETANRILAVLPPGLMTLEMLTVSPPIPAKK